MTKPAIAQPKAGGKQLHPRSLSETSPFSYSTVVQDKQWGVKVVKVTSKSEVRERIERERVVAA